MRDEKKLILGVELLHTPYVQVEHKRDSNETQLYSYLLPDIFCNCIGWNNFHFG